MHGVGRRLLEQVFTRAGHEDLHPVPEQADPDGDFPTVSFPNPEEPGALDLSLALGAKLDADLIIANDPDADRLAAAIPDGRGGFRVLTGNEIGCLLADDLLAHGPADARRMVATTIVSSGMLRRIAEAAGAAYAETLTGFKWIANRGLEFEAAGGRFVFGYEEALGYTPGMVVRDKDGVSSALLLVDLAAWCRSRGVTMLDHLAGLYRRHGLHASTQHSIVKPGVSGAAEIAAIMDGLRANPPRKIGGVAVRRLRDVATGRGIDFETGETLTIDLPSSNVLAFDLVDGSRVLARPSGTEPKIKFYFEVRVPMGADVALDAAEADADARIRNLVEAFVARATGSNEQPQSGSTGA